MSPCKANNKYLKGASSSKYVRNLIFWGMDLIWEVSRKKWSRGLLGFLDKTNLLTLKRTEALNKLKRAF